jgi:hypothetical protein
MIMKDYINAKERVVFRRSYTEIIINIFTILIFLSLIFI